MSYEEAKAAYIKKWGGFPEFLFMCASEDFVLPFILKALETGEEIEVPYDDEDIVY